MKSKIFLLGLILMFSFALVSSQEFSLWDSGIPTESGNCASEFLGINGIGVNVTSNFSVINFTKNNLSTGLVNASIVVKYPNGTYVLLASADYVGNDAFFDYVNITTDMVQVLFVGSGNPNYLGCWFYVLGHPMGDTTHFSTYGKVSLNTDLTGYFEQVGIGVSENPIQIGIYDFVTEITNCGVVDPSNYTITGGTITAVDGSLYLNSYVNVSYDYSFKVNSQAGNVAEDTNQAISGTTEWFPIVIVISVMIVLILLTVIIITTIRGSGLVASA